MSIEPTEFAFARHQHTDPNTTAIAGQKSSNKLKLSIEKPSISENEFAQLQRSQNDRIESERSAEHLKEFQENQKNGIVSNNYDMDRFKQYVLRKQSPKEGSPDPDIAAAANAKPSKGLRLSIDNPPSFADHDVDTFHMNLNDFIESENAAVRSKAFQANL